jgi:hypothetical protein
MNRKSIHKVLSLTLVLAGLPGFSWAIGGKTGGKTNKSDSTATHVAAEEKVELRQPEETVILEEDYYEKASFNPQKAPEQKRFSDPAEETLSHNYLFYLLYKFKYSNVFEPEDMPEYQK